MRLYTSELVKKYKARTVVDHVSIDVNQGEIVGLLGPNGAGKTTTFYMIVGLIKPNEGRIFLESDEGQASELTDLPVYRRAQLGVGYLAQEASVFRRLSVEDNIRAVLEMTSFSKEYQNERVEALIEEFRLQKVRKSLGIQLSGGERRRTEIARAVAINPAFILLDEPFAGVDPIAVEDIQSIVATLKHKNIGVIITDHNVDETLAITDRTYLLYEGKILKTGTAEELAATDVPHPSKTVMKHMGTPSVSEAAALLSSGNSELIMPKRKGGNYTVAAAINIRALRRGHIEIVGAGPGDPDLISVRGREMLEKADLILYAGSLVPRELTLCAKPGATVRSSASMDLEEQFALMKEFYDKGKFIVRLHTGDPCIYGAIQEQMAFFDRYGMSYHITPGISSFQAAAAALRSQFTIPEKVQTIILTRGEGRTPMPKKEQLHKLAASQSTMCIFLSDGIAGQVQKELLEHYPPTTPVAACYKLTWKDERIYRGELKDLERIVKENNLTLTTLLVVGDAIDNREGLSRLYADEFKHLFRH